MSKWVPRVAMSGFICCALYFVAALADLFFSKSGVINPPMNPDVKDYKVWLGSPIRSTLIISQDVLFPIIWLHVLFFMRKFKEYLFISLVIIFYNLWAAYTEFFNPRLALYNFNMIISIANVFLLIISLWFVKHPYLRSFTRWFTLALFSRVFIITLFGWLHDHIGFRWLLINPVIPSMLPYSVLIVMFLSIWVRSRNIYPAIEISSTDKSTQIS